MRGAATAVAMLLMTAVGALACGPNDARERQLRTSVELVGIYSNVQHSDEEHESGYTVELWRDQQGMFGIFRVHGPQIGDPAVGLMSDVKYEKATGQLQFSAKLSMSRGYSYKGTDGQMRNVPASHDVVAFDGRLNGEQLTGTVTINSTLGEQSLGQTATKLNLKRDPEMADTWFPADLRPATCAAWVDMMTPILKRSGPKW